MELKKIALHQIIKEEKKSPSLNESDHLLTVDEVTKEFIKKIIKSYSSKNPTYGAFDKDSANNPFQTYVKMYFEKKDFLDFSKKAMGTLKMPSQKQLSHLTY